MHVEASVAEAAGPCVAIPGALECSGVELAIDGVEEAAGQSAAATDFNLGGGTPTRLGGGFVTSELDKKRSRGNRSRDSLPDDCTCVTQSRQC